MTVIDLRERTTNDWAEFHRLQKSLNSKVYVSAPDDGRSDGPACLNVLVGDVWHHHKDVQRYAMGEDGIQIAPGQSVLIEAKRRIALPLNVAGIVTGKGNFIFQGAFVSTGKIDPGFNGHLKIGVFNGSQQYMKLKPDDIFATCMFFELQNGIDAPLEQYQSQRTPVFARVKRMEAAWLWVKNNRILTVTATSAALTALYRAYQLAIPFFDYLKDSLK